ncbi:MAG: hypothetical protein ACYDDQ_01970 [Vulcanimicrobiaceae bacterium]
MAKFPMFRAISVALIAALALSACAGSSIPSATQRNASIAALPCPLIRTVTTNSACGGGGGAFHTQITENGYYSYGAGDYSTYEASGYDTNSNGVQQGTSSGSTSFNPSDGTETITANVPSISSNPITYTATNGWYLQPGTNNLPGGITLTENSTNTVASFVDKLGRMWNLSGVLDPDGHDVDITFTVTGIGTWTQKFDANAFAPTELSSTSTATIAAMNLSVGHVAPQMGAGGVAAIAGAVAGVAGLVAVTAVFIPGGQPVAAVAGVIGGVAGAVAGVAACVDYFQNQKKKKK